MGLLILLCPSSAFACVYCVYEDAEVGFPPAQWWYGITAIWFVLLGIVMARAKMRIFPFLSIVETFILLLIVLVAALSFLGPLAFVLLSFPCIIVTIALFARRKGLEISARRSLIATTALMVMLYVTSALYAYLDIRYRDHAATILEKGFPSWKAQISWRHLGKKEDATEDYRRILLQGKDNFVWRSANSLLYRGGQDSEVELIIDEIEKRRERGEDSLARLLERSLMEKLDYPLPRDSSVEEWRTVWEEQKDQRLED